jgi:hypothetical protein
MYAMASNSSCRSDSTCFDHSTNDCCACTLRRASSRNRSLAARMSARVLFTWTANWLLNPDKVSNAFSTK